MKDRLIHPFLLALFPVLALFAANVGQAPVTDLTVALIAVAILVFVLMKLVGLVQENRHKAAAIASVWIVLLLSQGHIVRLLDGVHLGSILLWRERYVFAMALAIGAALTIPIVMINRSMRGLTRLLNVVGAALILGAIGGIAVSAYSYVSVDEDETSVASLPHAGNQRLTRPDIYYIVLDGYGGASTLRDLYGFDNSEFYGYLRKKGFYIASESRSNYPMTFLSLASSLNFRYIDTEAEQVTGGEHDRAKFYRLIQDSQVLRTLHQQGYRTVHFSSGWDATDRNPYADVNVMCGPFSDFSTTLIRMSAVNILERFVSLTSYVRPKKMMCVFDQLPKVRDRVLPTFVFAHIMAPHPPFVFGPNGEWIAETAVVGSGDSAWGNRKQYIDEVQFINRKVQDVLDEILKPSSRPIVVILQGDHGPESLYDKNHITDEFLRERFTIFNAYLIPTGQDELYLSISPVNSFRLILGRFFRLDLPLLPDRSQFAYYDDPFDLRDITERLPAVERKVEVKDAARKMASPRP